MAFTVKSRRRRSLSSEGPVRGGDVDQRLARGDPIGRQVGLADGHHPRLDPFGHDLGEGGGTAVHDDIDIGGPALHQQVAHGSSHEIGAACRGQGLQEIAGQR